MRVHIVCRDLREDKILPRLAKTLAEGTGWSLGEEPRDDVDLLYFMIYIDRAERFPFQAFGDTLVAAYFSHYETPSAAKVAWWNAAERMSDLAVITSDLYRGKVGLPIVKVRPPVSPIFTPAGPRVTVPRLGLSGVVTNTSPRKGEGLVRQLRADFPNLEVIATGRGWPVPTRWRPFEDLPDFYRSLRAYLCTSLIEGIPMPPLEALACGIPIVIPRKVGMLDDVADTVGIFRYTAGQYPEMKDAVDQALQCEPDPEELRELVAGYTPENWCEDHRRGFAEFLYQAPQEEELPDWKGRSGMYCVGFGEPSRKCALTVIRSFKSWMPEVSVAFGGTKALGPEDIFIPLPDQDIGGRLGKLAVYDTTPPEWDYVLYLDADTEVMGDLSPLYKMLADGWEALICKDMGKYHLTGMMRRPDNEAEYVYTMAQIGSRELLQYNGGVFAFRRCERMRRFFELWNKEWDRYGARDQGALLRALHALPIRLQVLTNHWNASTRYQPPDGEISILHHNMRARRWEGLIDGRIDSESAWQAVGRWERKHGKKLV